LDRFIRNAPVAADNAAARDDASTIAESLAGEARAMNLDAGPALPALMAY